MKMMNAMSILPQPGLRARIISSNPITTRPVMAVMPMPMLLLLLIIILPMGDIRTKAMNIKDDANNDDAEDGEEGQEM